MLDTYYELKAKQKDLLSDLANVEKEIKDLDYIQLLKEAYTQLEITWEESEFDNLNQKQAKENFKSVESLIKARKSLAAHEVWMANFKEKHEILKEAGQIIKNNFEKISVETLKNILDP